MNERRVHVYTIHHSIYEKCCDIIALVVTQFAFSRTNSKLNEFHISNAVC